MHLIGVDLIFILKKMLLKMMKMMMKKKEIKMKMMMKMKMKKRKRLIQIRSTNYKVKTKRIANLKKINKIKIKKDININFNKEMCKII